jgi:heme/copper-type cytochrome/quinol oxidase subunit 4
MIRKIIRTSVIILSFILILQGYYIEYIDKENRINFYLLYFIIAIPLTIYELIQIVKDDRVNNTNTGKKRILAFTTVVVILFLFMFFKN